MSDEGDGQDPTANAEQEASGRDATVTPIWRGLMEVLEKAKEAANPAPPPLSAQVTAMDVMEFQLAIEEAALKMSCAPTTGRPVLPIAASIADYLRARLGLPPGGGIGS